MNERLKTVLVLFALTPFLAGGGGFSGAGFTTVLPAAVNAHIVMDPHNNGGGGETDANATTITPTGRRASIRVTRGGASASAFFTVPSGFAFHANGCNVTAAVMEQRFVSVPNLRHVPMDVWIPGALAETLLTAVGMTPLTNAANATITSVDHASCTPDAGHPAGVVGPGLLSFHARIHLVQ